MLTLPHFDSATTTVGEIVAHDIRTAEVFKRLGIDFCCNGKRTLSEACDRAGVSVADVLLKLGHLGTGERLPSEQFDRWEPDFLVAYIVNVHHRYLYDNLPLLDELAEKVAVRHGERYPFVREVRDTFRALHAELLAHLIKEERVVFPYIRKLALAARSQVERTEVPGESLQVPIDCLEAEHDDAGTLLFRLNALTEGYHPPLDACHTHRLLYAKLAELEADLMQHIHLENNILFPKALRLEQVASA